MSSYSCVIPVNWTLLWEDVIPAWLSLLAGSLTPEEFYARYVPAGDEYGDLLEDDFVAPAKYLARFPTPLHPPYASAKLREFAECFEYRSVPDAASYLLEAAIKQSAAVNLLGDDPYAGNYYANTDDRSGKKQVAGTKNLYSFLGAAFEVKWCPETRQYSYSRKEGTRARLQELFESLFLYQQVIPGVWFPSESPIWPGYDDLSFAGYLSPSQVVQLNEELGRWECDIVEDEYELYSLFANRVRRAAESGYGLLTIHEGL